MPWFYLTIAGLLEVVWAVGMKQSLGFTRPWISIVTVAAMIASFGFLAIALRSLPLGTGYAVWTGIGAVGTALLGILVFGESTNPVRLVSISLIVAGIVGLKLASGEGAGGG